MLTEYVRKESYELPFWHVMFENLEINADRQ